ncbi:MAG TPA: hypothetical protein GX002_01185 [Clostridiales bacterium]|jgi:hypothetical protein|nr:hypothetical protein [Clostridiales bacterium]
MKQKWKSKLARATAGNYKLNKKIMRIKRSWDEVESILNGSAKVKKKPHSHRS